MAGQTRVFVEAYIRYAAGGNPRRTPLIGKITNSGWKLNLDRVPFVIYFYKRI